MFSFDSVLFFLKKKVQFITQERRSEAGSVLDQSFSNVFRRKPKTKQKKKNSNQKECKLELEGSDEGACGQKNIKRQTTLVLKTRRGGAEHLHPEDDFTPQFQTSLL